jgi:predicted dehydrogenase
MLDETRPDGCIVAVPNRLHLAAGLACIRRGIPSLVEKPLADTVAAARALADASEGAGVPVLVGHHRRHSPDIRAARQAIRDGAIGDLVAVGGMWLADKPDGYFAAEWRRGPGGGPLLINMIHDIDCLRFIAGEIESVRAITSNAVRGFEVEDTAAVAIRFEGGALGTFLLSDAVASPLTWDVASGQGAYFPHHPADCYWFGGRRGTLAVPGMTLWRHAAEGQSWQDPLVQERVALDGSGAYRNQADHFLAVVAREAEPVVSAREGMLTLAATLAVDRAAREDRTVAVAEMLR